MNPLTPSKPILQYNLFFQNWLIINSLKNKKRLYVKQGSVHKFCYNEIVYIEQRIQAEF